jgi:excisionase family DNA binding protein
MPNLLSDELRLEIASIVRDVIRNELAAHKSQTDEPLLNSEELADRLRVPVSWVYEASRRGDIPTVRIGRYIRFHLTEVLASEAKLRK